MGSISFDRAAEYYDATRGYPPGVADAIATALITASGATLATTFLEIGIGTGRIALPLIMRGYQYAGIDLSSEMVAKLRAKLTTFAQEHPDRPFQQPELRLGDSTALPYADASFDVVVAVHVLHLIAHWELALDEALRVLRPGGWFLAGNDGREPGTALPNINDLWSEELAALGYVDPLRERHQHPGADRQQTLDALLARGLAADVSRPVTWPVTKIPSQDVAYIAQRLWSRTWDIPDDIFAASVTRLEARARAELGDRYDQPITFNAQFILTRAQKAGMALQP